MLISFTGAQSTGKTTLLNLLKQDNYKDYIFIDEITRQIANKGYSINEDGDDNTQLKIMQSHLSNIEYKNAILDRCSLDGFCYTHYLYMHNKVNANTYMTALDIFLQTKDKYDIIFYLKPEFDIVDDGVRSSNKQFQDDMVKIFDNIINLYNIDVRLVSGTIEERFSKVKDIINRCS